MAPALALSFGPDDSPDGEGTYATQSTRRPSDNSARVRVQHGQDARIDNWGEPSAAGVLGPFSTTLPLVRGLFYRLKDFSIF